jgi:hypothetical protein
MDSEYMFRAVIIPAAQAAVTGFWTFIAGLSMCALGGWPWYDAAIIAGLAGLAAWVYFWSWWARIIMADTYPPVEVMRREEPEEPAEPQTVKVVITENQGRDTSFIDLPATPSQLLELAQGIENGRMLSGRTWAGNGGLFTDGEWTKLRDSMISRGLAAWNNPRAYNQGFNLTVAGVHVFRKIAKRPPLSEGE